eukprot:5139836-Ditylum_brightwellii.AAC.1
MDDVEQVVIFLLDSEDKEEEEGYFDQYDNMQPADHNDRTIVIQELALRMDAAENKLETQKMTPTEKETNQMDLMNTILERTAKLEVQKPNSVSKEMLQVMENTKLLEKKQKEYGDWKKVISKELDTKFKEQKEKIDNMDERLIKQDGKMDNLLASMALLTQNVITEKDINPLAVNNNALMIQVNALCAQIEHIERTTTILSSPKSLNSFEIVGKYPSKARSTSPPAEMHEKRHNSLDKVCNTPNIIMGSQE